MVEYLPYNAVMGEVGMLISSINFKGGQGKSLWTAILANWLGAKVEILDLDPRQGDAHAWAEKAGHPSRLIWPRELTQVLRDAANSTDWLVADCPPHEGEESRLALELSAMVFVPVVPAGAQDARAWGRMQDAVNDAKTLNPGLKAAAILNATRNTAISREFLDLLHAWHSPRQGRAVLGAVPQHVALAEAFGAGRVPSDETISAVLAKLRRFATL
jgi:cellulose biosynthesis protein BcsQ